MLEGGLTKFVSLAKVVALWCRRDSDQTGLLEAPDVADMIGMSVDWVYAKARADRLPHVRLGRYVRFRGESIEAWLATRERGSTAANVGPRLSPPNTRMR